MCPHHPIPFTRSPVCPCRREAGSGAACGEGAQNRRGAARLDAVTVRAETLKGRVLLCGGFVRPASLFGGFVNIGGRIRPSGHLKAQFGLGLGTPSNLFSFALASFLLLLLFPSPPLCHDDRD